MLLIYRVTSQFDRGNISSLLTRMFPAGVTASNSNNRNCFCITRSRYAVKIQIQKHFVFLMNCEEPAVQIVLVRHCHTVSWQVHLYLILLSLVEVHNRAVNYYKTTASPINKFRNSHT